MRRLLFTLLLGGLFAAGPSFAFAAGTASVGALVPGTTVGVGTRVTFSLIMSGFTNPTYYLVDSFPGGAVTFNLDQAGNFGWTPSPEDIGSHTLTITISDSQGNSATATQTLTVVKPSVSVSTPSPAATVLFGNQVSFTITSTGFEAPLYEIADPFSGSSISYYNLLQNGQFRWTPLFADIGTHGLVVSARDNRGHFASTTQAITVEGAASVWVPNAPAAVPIGQLLTFAATTTGFVNPSLSIVDLFYASPASSTLKFEAGRASWSPVYNDLGGHTLVITATDSAGHTATARLALMVVQSAATPVQTQPQAATPATPAPSGTTASSYVFKTFLTVGSSGAAVTALQQKLTVLGVYSGPITGYFGNLTAAGVKAFQKSVGLEQVGYVGPGTRAALNR